MIIFLIKLEKWMLNVFIKDKDDLAYEDCFYAILKHEKEIARIERENKIN